MMSCSFNSFLTRRHSFLQYRLASGSTYMHTYPTPVGNAIMSRLPSELLADTEKFEAFFEQLTAALSARPRHDQQDSVTQDRIRERQNKIEERRAVIHAAKSDIEIYQKEITELQQAAAAARKQKEEEWKNKVLGVYMSWEVGRAYLQGLSIRQTYPNKAADSDGRSIPTAGTRKAQPQQLPPL